MMLEAESQFTLTPSLVPRHDPLRPAATALLVIDLQVGFVEEGQLLALPAAAAILPGVNDLVRVFRRAGAVVAFTRHTVTDSGPCALPEWLSADPWSVRVAPLLASGAPAHGLSSSLDTAPQDLVVDKFRASAFNRRSSDLDAQLQARGIDTIVITGCVTNICCESTARDGHMLGYRTIVVSDLTAARTSEEQDAALLNLGVAFANICTAEEVCARLAGA